MKHYSKNLAATASIIGILLLSVGLLPSSPVRADQDIVCDQLQGELAEQCRADENTVQNITDTAVDILTFLVGAISVIAIVMAGFMYVTSGGEPEKTKKAKNTIIYALVAIVLAVLANAIVGFVLDQV